ncbi:hypothetical protein WJX72_007877 [[Myrmecia] bisecta]|uniref:Protein yippee-like n=1 Tax=[Myrmecia] bisecta TaxID=41462 RepID=A0AAW1PXW9_9CHLO
MGRLYVESLEGRVYSCKHCGCHLASATDLVSKSFHSRNGKAYLYNSVANVSVGPKEDRLMTTGLHTVADLNCRKCLHLVGWKYEAAFDKGQQYKVGKYILERQMLMDTYEGYSSCSQDLRLEDSDTEDTCWPS